MNRDLVQLILDKLLIKDAVNLLSIDSFLFNDLKLRYINQDLMDRLTQDLLEAKDVHDIDRYLWEGLIILKLKNNKNILSIPPQICASLYLLTLNKNITQANFIHCIKLISVKIGKNQHINNFDHLSGSIQEIKNNYNNYNTINIKYDYLNRLQYLSIFYYEDVPIVQHAMRFFRVILDPNLQSIANLRFVTELYLNNYITNIDHLADTLTFLLVRKSLYSVDKLIYLRDLSIIKNRSICNYNTLKNLKTLYLEKCILKTEYIANLPHLYDLTVIFLCNKDHIDLNSLHSSLKILMINSCNENFNNDSIKDLQLTSFHLFNNMTITNIDHMKESLQRLELFKCAIERANLSAITVIEDYNAD